MANHVVGSNTPRAPKLRQRILEREERRLRVRRLVDGRLGSLLRVQHGEQRLLQVGAEDRVAAVDGRTESRFGLVELPSHSGELGALSRKQERKLRPEPGAHRATDDTRRGFALGKVVQRLAQRISRIVRFQRFRKNGQALFENTARGVRGITEVPDRGGISKIAGRIRPGELLQSRLRARGKRQHVARPILLRRLDSRGSQGRFFKHNMTVRAAEPEGANAGETAFRSAGPRQRFRRNLVAGFVQLDERVHFVEMQVRRNRLVLQREDGLDQSDDARSGFQMPHVRLGRSNGAGVALVTSFGQNGLNRLDLDRIAKRRARTVSLDIGDLGWRDGRVFQRSTNDRLLGLRARCGETVAVPDVVHRCAANNCEHVVAVGQGVG